MLNVILNSLPSAAVLIVALVWLRSRFEKYFDSYMDEKGKILARKEDIGELANEVRVLTKEAETIKAQLSQQTEIIKAQLSQENWDRQQRWLKRLDCYVDVVETLHRYADAAIKVRASQKGLTRQPGPSELYNHALDMMTTAMEEYNVAVSALGRARTTAQLMAAKEPLSRLNEFLPPAFNDSELEAELDKAGLLARLIADDVVVRARVDLGYDRANGVR